MKYVKINSNNISKLVLGTVQFGLDYGISNKYGKPSLEVTNEILKLAYESGINSFDTAEIYGNAQEILGNFLEQSQNKFLISKIDTDMFLNKNENHIIDQILQKLKINTLDTLLLHDNKLIYGWNSEFSNSVSKLKEQNKISYFGTSIYTAEEFELSISNDDIDVIQIPFNIFDLRALKYEWFKKAEDKNKLLLIRSVYLQGLLCMNLDAVPHKLNRAIPYLAQLNTLTEITDLSKTELLLGFVNTVANKSPILFGTNTLSSTRDTIETFNSLNSMDDSLIKEIINEFSTIDESIYNPKNW